MPEYDHPFYKQLRRNDLPIAANQGGPAIPKALAQYFPPLPPPSGGPTEEYFLTLDLFDGSTAVCTVTSRWHYQTWKQTRTPEYRLTRNIDTALLESAKVDDILMFERQTDAIDRYRVSLVRSDTRRHRMILRANAGSRWGLINGVQPSTLTGIRRELDDIVKLAQEPFQMFAPRKLGQPHARLLRDAAFARLVKRAYGHRCAVCGTGWLVPLGNPGLDPTSEPEAAHIVPVELDGVDDLRNSLCLCRSHHWAFDKRILYVDPQGIWRVPPSSFNENRNTTLNDIELSPLIAPRPGYPPPAHEALAWHRQMVLRP